MNKEKYCGRCGFSYLDRNEEALGTLECELTNRRCIAFKKRRFFPEFRIEGRNLVVYKMVKSKYDEKVMANCPLYFPKPSNFHGNILINFPDEFTIRNLVFRLIEDIKVRGYMNENKVTLTHLISAGQAIKDIVKYGRETAEKIQKITSL